MYNLLIADDEPIITDSLCELFSGRAESEYNVLRAYSGGEALGWLERTRVDILLTDISMPDASGLDVHLRAAALWPECLVIYLTSFDDFEYAQQAIRNETVDYILKTEGDDAVVAAVERAAARIEALRRDRTLVERANDSLKLALPLLRERFVSELLEGAAPENGELQVLLDEFGIPLDAGRPVLMALGLADDPQATARASGMRRAYAAAGALEAFFGGLARCACAVHERTRLVLLMQPAFPADARPRRGECAAAARDLAIRVSGSLDRLQALCAESGLEFSFAASGNLIAWEEMGGAYGSLLGRLQSAAAQGGKGLLYFSHDGADGAAGAEGRLSWEDTAASLRGHGDTLPHRTDGEPGRDGNRIFAFVRDYARDNMGGDLSLTKFAMLLNFHPFYLSKLFRQIAGVTLSDYISGLRLEKARELLRGGNGRVAEISTSLGFMTPSYFTSFFRKHTGMSPVEYRNAPSV